MAMLAERKRKQKWSLNPRGKHWSDDVNKFGQKMLEKMGWTAGKGLGLNEDGMKEHVKINYKNDAKGMGFKDNGEQWTQHENDFSSLLETLGGSENTTDNSLQKPDRSLEEKSRSSRARVHYHKFTRGKDLSLRSEKDLANIFGRKTLERPVETENQPELEPETSESKEHGVVTVASGSMADYFKSKLSKLSNTFATSTKNNQEDGSESESEIGRCNGFGFGSKNVNPFNSLISAVTNEEQNGTEQIGNMDAETGEAIKEERYPDEEQEIISDKKRKRKRGDDEDESQLDVITKKIKKKKKKLAFDNAGLDVNVDEEVCYDNPCLEELNVSINGNSVPEIENSSNAFVNLGFNPTYDNNSKVKKKVTFASPETDGINRTVSSEEENAIQNMAQEETPKKSKKKKQENEEEKGLDNPACDVLDLDDSFQYEEEQVNVIKKSKRKGKNKEEFISNESCDVTNGDETNNDAEIPKKSKKKSKKRQSVTDSVDKPETPKKSKNQTKNPEIGIDNLACVVNTVEEGVASITNALDNYQNELENELNERKAVKKFPTPNKKIVKRYDGKSSLKTLVTAGQLRVNFSGANLDKIPGYGVKI